MLFLAASLLALPPAEHARGVSFPTVFYTVAKTYDPLAWMEGGERFSSAAKIFIRDGKGTRILAPKFAASADPAVSYDATHVLFAAKRTLQDKWQIWEIALADGKATQTTECSDDCIRPFYLPDERIVFAEKVDGRFVIQTAAIDGGKKLALTYGPENALPTDVLRDGRVLFESSYPFGEKGIPELYTVYSDGSGVESYRCDHHHARFGGKQIESGDIVFATAHGLARFTSARATQVPVPAPVGEYSGDLAEVSTGKWLISYRPDRSSQFRLMWWKPGEVTLQPAVEEKGSHLLQPVLLSEQQTPKRHPSGLHDWTVSNLLCLNAYTSKYKFQDGAIRSVRLYTRDATGTPQQLGTAPVEADGSFFVQISGDQPLQIELLDSSGKTLKREEGWFWLRKGEQRACVGCHAGPETAPENAAPIVLLKSTTPADMTHPVGNVAQGGH